MRGIDRIYSGKSEVGTNTSSWGEKEGCYKGHGFELGLKDDVDTLKSMPLQDFINRGKDWARRVYQLVSGQPGLLIHPAMGE